MSSFVNESSSLINFLHLYQRICNAEGPTNHKNQKEIRSYYYFGEALKNRLDSILTENQIPLHSAQVILNREVRQQLSVDISDSMKSVLLEYLMFILFLQMQSQDTTSVNHKKAQIRAEVGFTEKGLIYFSD
ncbi:10353_t:CDS:2 [Entrophospora sp. SA101]|nr:10353_t:CDS:2 [Entrophospora sp. SA101]